MKMLRFLISVVLLVQGLLAHGAEYWQASHGPEGGNVNAFAYDGGTLYIGTLGGVFKSEDKGISWAAASNGMTNTNVHAFALALDGTLYAVTERGLFRSLDKSATWSATSNTYMKSHTYMNVQALALAPDGTLYAGTSGSGVFKSSDKGTTWTKASGDLTNADVRTLVLAPDGTLYAGTWGGGGGVFRSTDKGATWISEASFQSSYVSLIIVSTDGDLYVVADSTLFKGMNKGASWTKLSLGLGSLVNNFALASDGVLYAATYDGLYRSADKGTTWVGIGGGHITALMVSPDGALHAGIFAKGVYKSIDKGTSWIKHNQGLSVSSTSSLVIAQNGTLYAGTYGGCFKSDDMGASWVMTGSGPNDLVYALAVALDGAIYAGTEYGLFKSLDNGASWITIPRISKVNSIVTSPDGSIYVGTQNGLDKSLDKGASWTTIYSSVDALTLSPDGSLYAGKFYGVFKSKDKGATWTPSSNGLSEKRVRSLTSAPDGTLYVSLWGGEVFRSVDNGETWNLANNGLNYQIVETLLAMNGTLYAGMWGGGVYRSADKGTTWTAANSGLTNLTVKALAVALDGSLYAGTIGGGVQHLPLSAGKLTTLTLQSPVNLAENTLTTLQAEALYDNGYRQTVKPTWSLDNPAAASIAANGKLTALPVDQDTPVKVTATYSEGGVTQSISRLVVVKSTPAPLISLQIRSAANTVTSGGAVTLKAIAKYQDDSSSRVEPVWRVASGPASISADGILTAQTVTAATPISVSASYTEGALTKSANLTLTAKPAGKLKFLKILGPMDVIGGQTVNYRAKAVYENGTEAEITPTWTSQDALSPITPTGELRADDANKQFSLVANYSENGAAAAITFPIYVTPSTAKPNTLTVRIPQVATLFPGDELDVDLSFDNFEPAKRFDLYTAVALPNKPPTFIYLNDSGDESGQPSFMNQMAAYRPNTLLPQSRQAMLRINLPAELQSGVYTFYALAIRTGADVKDQSQWISLGSATVTVR